MGLIRSTKEISTCQIPCGGAFQITLTLTAEPDILTAPTDIILILDCSQSMDGQPLCCLKKGALEFIRAISCATGESGGCFGCGCRVGVVSFSTAAQKELPLTCSVQAVQKAIGSLSACGATNHQDGFRQALEMLPPEDKRNRIFVLFTDGVTTAGCPAVPAAREAKRQGVTIYAMGIQGNGGLDRHALESWASDPSAAHVCIADSACQIGALFSQIADSIMARGAATHIRILETVRSNFFIEHVSQPTKGSARLLDDGTLQWRICQLGCSCRETAALTFTVRHTGCSNGKFPVNERICYRDDEGNTPCFGSPAIRIYGCPDHCCCPEEIAIPICGCRETTEFDADRLCLDDLGRILQLNVTIANVCPEKRVALAVLLTELDPCGCEHKRGLKTILVPAHHGDQCRDVTVRCIRFVLPEELDVTGCPDSICNRRRFRAEILANYVDYDFICC